MNNADKLDAAIDSLETAVNGRLEELTLANANLALAKTALEAIEIVSDNKHVLEIVNRVLPELGE